MQYLITIIENVLFSIDLMIELLNRLIKCDSERCLCVIFRKVNVLKPSRAVYGVEQSFFNMRTRDIFFQFQTDFQKKI